VGGARTTRPRGLGSPPLLLPLPPPLRPCAWTRWRRWVVRSGGGGSGAGWAAGRRPPHCLRGAYLSCWRPRRLRLPPLHLPPPPLPRRLPARRRPLPSLPPRPRPTSLLEAPVAGSPPGRRAGGGPACGPGHPCPPPKRRPTLWRRRARRPRRPRRRVGVWQRVSLCHLCLGRLPSRARPACSPASLGRSGHCGLRSQRARMKEAALLAQCRRHPVARRRRQRQPLPPRCPRPAQPRSACPHPARRPATP
jgi:hypothetical protein